MASGKTIQEIEQLKSEKMMNAVAWRAGYYRANPQRFCSECLGLNLKLFQKILIWAMFHFNYLIFIAARGQGKTYLTALYCAVRCILYPGTKIVVTSGTLKQANEVLLKIQDELMHKSAFLRNEIKKCGIGQNDATIEFYNGSWIKTRTSTDSARSARANTIVVDEYRMVNKFILDTVIKKFLADSRHPAYLDKPEYAHLQERNSEIYMSSAYYKDSWAYEKAQAYTVNFFDDKKKYFICALPYQLSIYERLLMREQVEDEFSEADFSIDTWIMEMECIWLGDDDNSFFKLDDLNKARRLDKCLYPLEYYSDIMPVPEPPPGGHRVLSLDIALMASTKKKKNDASALYINDLELISSAKYRSNFIYGETFEGLTTDALGLILMRYFNKYKCDQLVLDCAGVGLGVYDYICRSHYDPETGETYMAMKCCNDDDMAIRCKEEVNLPCVWSVKANLKFNSQICLALRDGIRNGRVNFLKGELLVDDIVSSDYKGYKKLSLQEQARLKTAYVQTTMAVFELIKLHTVMSGGTITVKEQSGMRKDRYSSIAYNYWCASQLEQQLRPRSTSTQSLIDQLTIRRGSYNGKVI